MARRQQISYLPSGMEREQSRRQGRRPKRRSILIVCEGESTEPNYFRAFCRKLVGGEGDRVEVVGVGDNTLHLVEEAKKIVERRRHGEGAPFYYVWVVFRSDLGVADGYRKNDPDMFERLKARISKAIERGERAFQKWQGRAPHECNPATRVFELVKLLYAYA